MTSPQSLLQHYITSVMRASGLQVDSDVQMEIADIIDQTINEAQQPFAALEKRIAALEKSLTPAAPKELLPLLKPLADMYGLYLDDRYLDDGPDFVQWLPSSMYASKIEGMLSEVWKAVHAASVPESLAVATFAATRKEVEANGTLYITWYKTYESTFGNLIWGVNDRSTGLGGGGFSATEDEAKQAIREYIRDQDPDHYAATLERETETRLDQEQAEREEQTWFEENDETHLAADE